MTTQAEINNRDKKSFRIRLRLHYTWFFAFLFIIGIVATQYPESYIFYRRILLGIVASLIFLLMVIFRQLALNLIAGRRNIIFRRVTLYIFGGVPGIMREYTSPVLEILLGTAGLMFNLLITVFLYSIYVVLVIVGNTLFGNIIAWLSFLFLLFTVFHFIPAFPLDGGRILRALIWRGTHDYDRATRVAAWIGQGVGIACIISGLVFLFANQEWLLGTTLVLVGWALAVAATRISRNTILRHSLKDIMVKDTMSKQYPHAAPHMSVAKIIREYCLVSGQYYFTVVEEDKLLGSVGLRDIKSVPRRLRERTGVEKVMTPSRNMLTANTNQSAEDAYEQMVEMEFGEMPVMEEGKVVGAVFQDKLHRLARIKTELRM
jgi:Zn-dependent protease